MSDGKCNDCKHRLPRHMCGCRESLYFNGQIELTDSCDQFLKNPAQDHFTRGLKLALDDGNDSEVLREFQLALSEGLPADDEVSARAFLGSRILEGAKDDVEQDQIMSQRLSEGLSQFEAALSLDAEGRYGFFAAPLNRSDFGQLESLYALRGRSIAETKGIDAQIEYLEKKLRLFEYLSGVHTPNLHLELGFIYAEKGQNEQAAAHWRKVLEAEDLDEEVVGEEAVQLRAETKKKARNNLAVSGPETSSKSGCFLATCVYGGYENKEVQILERYRDDVLSKTQIGAVLVRLYYQVSPWLVKRVERHDLFKRIVRAVVIAPFVAYARLRCGEGTRRR